MYVDLLLAAQLVNLFGFLIPLAFAAFIARIYQEAFFAAWTKGYASLLVFFILLISLQIYPTLNTPPLQLLALGSYHAGAFFLMRSARLLLARRFRWVFHPLFLYGLPAIGALLLWRTGNLGYALLPSAAYVIAAHLALGWALSHFPAAFYRSANRNLGILVGGAGLWTLAVPILATTRFAWLSYLVSGLLHVFIGVWMVIFLLRRAQRELEQNNAELRQLDTLKTDFLHRVSHELRTPLTSLITGHYLLRTYHRSHFPEQVDEILSDVEGSTKRLNGLVSDLLNYAKLESEDFQLHPEDVAVDELITDLASEFHITCQAKGVQLDLVREAPLHAWVDREALRQLLSNLLMNALKFTPRHGKITLRVSAEAESLRLEVSDTGIGIATEERERIFERFVQLKTRGGETSGGVGLGLAICASIVERHQGRIWVDSQPGEGSHFFVELPLAPAPGVTKGA